MSVWDLFIKAGVVVNYYNRSTSLNLARDVKVAELLIKTGADVNASVYDSRDTPLTSAASGGHTELVSF